MFRVVLSDGYIAWRLQLIVTYERDAMIAEGLSFPHNTAAIFIVELQNRRIGLYAC